ncbi:MULTISPECIES: hypothetical protein [unclassified Methylobacterium]|uniref:hypothetical protein n=1 Tax=unclassified Methylobacterium TaxID=2615210 RepID=UPI001FBA61F4|nr:MULTISPECIES: hypothetical protein [unclassified Methylobacterium]MCJ2019423.1 hypothetical protein [Methylobacterium sp. E-065]
MTASRHLSIRARILIALTDEPISTLQLAERASITARRRAEVVKLACDVLEGEGLIERVGGRNYPKWRRLIRSTSEPGMNTALPPSSGWVAPGPDAHLAQELVQGLVQSAIAKGGDPVARLQEFRTLQQAALAISRNATLARAAEELVRAIDLRLQELTTMKS